MFTIATYRFLLPSGCVLRITRNFVVHSKLYQVEKKETPQSKLVQSSTTHNNVNTSSIGEKGTNKMSHNFGKLHFVYCLWLSFICLYLIYLVKDAGKTLWYSGIVIVGFLATGAILFAVIKELFSNQSPQYIYSDALKKCTEFPRVCDLLGEPIVGFCEGSGRRSRTVLRFSLCKHIFYNAS